MSFLDSQHTPTTWGGGQPTTVGYQRMSRNEDDYTTLLTDFTEQIKQLMAFTQFIRVRAACIGTDKDSKDLREEVQQKMEETRQLLRNTQLNLTQLTELVAMDKEKKLKVFQLGYDFEKLKASVESTISAVKTKLDDNELPSPFSQSYASYETAPEDEEAERIRLIYEQQNKQRVNQYNQIEDDITFTDGIQKEYDDDIKKVQSETIAVNDIFRILGTLVEEQAPMVENVATNILHTKDNVGVALSETQAASEYQGKTRKKICFIAIAVTILVAILVIVLVFVLKPK